MLSCLSLTDNESQQQVMLNPTTPSVQHHSQMKNKENIPPNKGKETNNSTVFGSPLRSRSVNNESLSTSHSSSSMTSETQTGPSQETTPTLNRQEVLRQQELEQQLKALQEQVSEFCYQ